MSARSITEQDLIVLYAKNSSVKYMDFNTEYRKGDELSNWGGPVQRMMMQAIYALSFLCLLRFDEVLKIQHHHIEVIDSKEGHIKLVLPFRKTHQNGGKTLESFYYFRFSNCSIEIKPFHLWFNREKLHLDPVHALLRWIKVSNVRKGFIFRKVSLYDQVSAQDKPLVRTSKLSNNLSDFIFRVVTCFLRIFGGIYLKLDVVPYRTVHILSVVEVASTSQVLKAGT